MRFEGTRSFVLVAAAVGALATLSFSAVAQDTSTEKSAPVKGPPNANGGEASDHAATTPKMKGSPNASGYDESKEKAAAPK